MKNLIKAAWTEPLAAAPGAAPGAADFERRVMLAIARAESERLRRCVGWTMIAAAACIVGLLISLPIDALIDGFGSVATEIFSTSIPG